MGEDKGLAMQAQIAPGLWVLGDRNLIAQLISNLLDNAIKFTPAGGQVSLTLAEAADRHVLTVADSGPGLAPELREAVFDRFVRAGPPTAASRATGWAWRWSRRSPPGMARG